MFRPYMAIIRFFSFPLRFRYINCDVEISHPIIILLCLCIGGYHITFIYIYIFYIFTLCCFTSNLRIYIFYIRYELCFWLPSQLSRVDFVINSVWEHFCKPSCTQNKNCSRIKEQDFARGFVAMKFRVNFTKRFRLFSLRHGRAVTLFAL